MRPGNRRRASPLYSVMMCSMRMASAAARTRDRTRASLACVLRASQQHLSKFQWCCCWHLTKLCTPSPCLIQAPPNNVALPSHSATHGHAQRAAVDVHQVLHNRSKQPPHICSHLTREAAENVRRPPPNRTKFIGMCKYPL